MYNICTGRMVLFTYSTQNCQQHFKQNSRIFDSLMIPCIQYIVPQVYVRGGGYQEYIFHCLG